MGISVKQLKTILNQYMLDNSLNKKRLANKFNIHYSTLLDIFNEKRLSVSNNIESKFNEIIKLYDTRITPDTAITNQYIVNIFNILPEESKGYIVYFLLKCLGQKNSNYILDHAYSMLNKENKKAFEYHMIEIARDILRLKNEELKHEVSSEIREKLEKELGKYKK